MEREPAHEARTVPLPDDLHPRLSEALRAGGVGGLFTHQAEALAAARAGRHVLVATGTASGKTLAFNLPVLDMAAEPKLRALYLYPTKALAQDQARSLAALARASRTCRDLRRRHRAGTPPADPQVGERHPDEPRHAQRRCPAAPRPLGRPAGVAPVRRRGRGARVPGRVRLPRGERAPAPAASRGGVRLRAAVLARVGDHRQPRRARSSADRCGRRRRRPRRSPAPRADDRALEPAADRPGARSPRQRPGRGLAPVGRARRTRAAHDLLHEEPQGRGAHPPLHARAAWPRLRRATVSVPGRLYACPTPRDRATAGRGRAARSHRDGCPRARHRHRAAGLRHLGRIPRHRGEPPAAVGPCRSPRGRPRSPRRE